MNRGVKILGFGLACVWGVAVIWGAEDKAPAKEEAPKELVKLDGAEEIFLTNARIGIKSVRSWRGKKLAVVGVAAELRKACWAE